MQPEPDTRVLPPRQDLDAVPPAAERRTDGSGRHAEPVILQRWVGRYELIHRLAHGGMATVYLGRAKGKAGFEKVVAVKVIHPHLASEAEFVGMFLDEARIAARIHHPHVVEILDLGEDEGVYYMVMEFIEGENLAALVRALAGERLPIPVILQILADTLEGLSAAHELEDANGVPYRLVHRDVSPHNILIGLDGRAKVGDFGIMKAAGKASNTKTGELRGKLAYMSPEQARGGALDHRTDLFALGVLAWELLAGERLFACPTEAATLEKVMACEIPDPFEIGERVELAGHEELESGLRSLLGRALAVDPDDRFEDAATMLAEVKRLIRLADDLPCTSKDAPADKEADARTYLGDLMRRFFLKRVDYARAALRRTGEHDAVPGDMPLADSRDWIVDPTVHVERSPSGTHPGAGRGPGTSGAPTGSNPTLDSVGSGPHALAAQLSGPHVVQARTPWLMWLLLPMLGAAIAVVAMSMLPGFERAETPPPTPIEPPPESAESTPSSLAATEYQPVAPADHSDDIRWYFTTKPPGARVLIDGEVRGNPTPTWVVVPAGEEPVKIELELEGHETRVDEGVPVATKHWSYALSPLVEADARQPAKMGAKRVRKRDDTDTTSKPGGSPSPSESGSKKAFVPVPASLLDDK